MIPREMGNLGKFNVLSELVLHSTNLSGQVPAELGLLSSLHTLDLGSTSLTGGFESVFCEENSALSLPNLSADCGPIDPEVTCSCCTKCCNDNGGCVANVPVICSKMAEQVVDPDQPVEFVIIQDDVKPVNPSCTCSEIPPSANASSVAGKIPIHRLSCDESPECSVCTPDGSVCGRRVNFGFDWNKNGIWTHQRMGFQYTKGLDDFLLLEFDISAQSPPYVESVFLNGKRCNQLQSEATCIDGKPGFEVDCSNVRPGAVYSQCQGIIDDAGVLEYFTPTMYGISASCEEESNAP